MRADADCGGDYDLDSAGRLEIELFGLMAGSQYDQLEVSRDITLDADGASGFLDLVFGFHPMMGDIFDIVDNMGSDPIMGRFSNYSNPDPEHIYHLDSFGGIDLKISYSAGTGNDVRITIVPEPSTRLLLVGGLVIMAARLGRPRRAGRSVRA